jgi:hypothetical protein
MSATKSPATASYSVTVQKRAETDESANQIVKPPRFWRTGAFTNLDTIFGSAIDFVERDGDD